MNETDTQWPDNVTIYNYTAISPSDGHCEYQQIGPVGHAKELGNVFFGLATAAEGIFGIVTCRHVNISSRYLFSLLFAFGFMSGLHGITLWNGFEKTAQLTLNMLQTIVIVSLGYTLRVVKLFQRGSYLMRNLFLMAAGLYPIVTHILGSSYDNEWVGWLTFDGIWALVLILGILIFVFRKDYHDYELCPEIFCNIWIATVCCVLAYIFWLLDRFACSMAVAVTYCLGWWYILMGLCFYYLIVLNAFLHAAQSGHKPVVWGWPRRYCHLVVFVMWEELGGACVEAHEPGAEISAPEPLPPPGRASAESGSDGQGSEGELKLRLVEGSASVDEP